MNQLHIFFVYKLLLLTPKIVWHCMKDNFNKKMHCKNVVAIIQTSAGVKLKKKCYHGNRFCMLLLTTAWTVQ